MRRVLILTGVLGGGTALTLAAAALAITMFPSGPIVYRQPEVFWAKPMPMPFEVQVPAPDGVRGVDLPRRGGVTDGAAEEDAVEAAPGG